MVDGPSLVKICPVSIMYRRACVLQDSHVQRLVVFVPSALKNNNIIIWFSIYRQMSIYFVSFKYFFMSLIWGSKKCVTSTPSLLDQINFNPFTTLIYYFLVTASCNRNSQHRTGSCNRSICKYVFIASRYLAIII